MTVYTTNTQIINSALSKAYNINSIFYDSDFFRKYRQIIFILVTKR